MVATLTANNNKGEKMAIPVDDLLPILKAAYEVLQESPGRQGHVSDIAEAAVVLLVMLYAKSARENVRPGEIKKAV